jgi:histidyl-tRNA synthetase
MKLSTQPYKGTRDFYPEDMCLRNWMFAKMRRVCESYGYEEYDVPVLEPLELYASKTSEEIINQQSFSFLDRGDRKVIMRPEITPSVSRMVAARRQELGYPLRLYSIPNCFRYERPQKGRLREFWQLNADIFGVESIEADTEMIKLADDIMKEFGAKEGMYEIRVNSRKFLDKKVKEAAPKVEMQEVTRLIDNFEKMDETDFEAGLSRAVEKPDGLYQFLISGAETEELKEIKSKCKSSGVDIRVEHTLARGFDYYTDIVFEVFDKNPGNNRSMFGGGRYDNLLSNFGVEPVPSVGFGMGDATLLNFVKANKLVPELKTSTDVAVLLIGNVYEKSRPIINSLRGLGVNVSVDYEDRKVDKKIKSALKRGERYVLFIGQDEIQKKQFTLKDLDTSKETKETLENIARTVKTRQTRTR